MSFLKKYKTDKSAEVKGVWVEVDENEDGTKVEWLIARINNENARDLRRKLETPYRNFPKIPDSVSEDILRKVVAKTILLGWKGMTDEDDKVIEFSPEAAEKLLKDYPDMMNDVVGLSMARETFQAEGVEAVKNA